MKNSKNCKHCHGQNETCSYLNEDPPYFDCPGCEYRCCGFCIAKGIHKPEAR